MSDLVQIELLGPMSSQDREERFERPLHAALISAGIGEVLGGHDQLHKTTHFLDGTKSVWVGVDVALVSLKSGLPFLVQELKRLGADKHTSILYSERGQMCGQSLNKQP